MMQKRWQRTVESISIPIIALVLALIASSIFVVLAGSDPIQTYERLFCEGFGPRGCETFGDLLLINVEMEAGGTQTVFAPTYGVGGHSLALAVELATPLILTALAAAVAFQSGMFSIGMDGQLVLGAVAAVFLGYWIPDQIYLAAGVTEPETAPESLLMVM